MCPTASERGIVAEPSVPTSPDVPVSSASIQLFVDDLREGAKPASQWRCGFEFELFGYTADGLNRLDERQVRATVTGLASSSEDLRFEGDVVSGAVIPDQGDITVEPGGQIEFSGVPRRDLLSIEVDLRKYLARLHEIATENGFVFLAAGFDPIRSIEDQHWYPKPRYGVMRPYLATRGRLAWDMMCRTCALQTSLDYGSEIDLAKKFVLGNRLAPIITAMFANSPFVAGAPSGYKSMRAATWLETDADRSGLSPFVFADDFSIEAFVEYALSVPMIFLRRDDRYFEAKGIRFGEFLGGAGNGIRPRFQDWTDHLSAIFTEARLRRYIEMRSADGGSLLMALALAAFWKGLMYDEAVLDEALLLVPKLDANRTRAFQEAVARDALATRFDDIDVLQLAKELLKLATLGLGRIAPDETRHLDILHQQVVDDEVCVADILLRNWHGSWNRSMSKVVEYLRIA